MNLQKLLRFTLGILAAACLLPGTSAADSNLVDAIKTARAPRNTAWGEVHVGVANRMVQEPRGALLGQRLNRIFPQPVPPPPPPVPQDLQQNALEQLTQRNPATRVYLRSGNQTVLQIRGGILHRPQGGLLGLSADLRSEQTARSFLREHRQVLLLDDPDGELVMRTSQADESGRRNLRFHQKYQNLSVWPCELAVHLDAQGNVVLVDGAYVPTPSRVKLDPIVTAEQARALALACIPQNRLALADQPSLVIYANLTDPPRLAWKTVVTIGLSSAWEITIDARDGRVLSRTTQCHNVGVATSAPDLEGINRAINVWSDAGKFYMIDSTKQSFNPAFDPVKDPRGAIVIYDARLVAQDKLESVFLVESGSATSWLPDAVSALYNFSHTYDYFLGRLNRSSIDGQGGSIRAAVRVDRMANAFWNGQAKIMVFGNAEPYASASDVVGHELAHGVTQFSAGLVYELQPGAMNESFSDIFGEMVEASILGRNDWKVGSKLSKALRDMKSPGSIMIGGLNRPYPSKMSEYLDLPNSDDSDHGGVHLNSSILNHCFYLLAEGLPGAIGLADAEKIFYRCLTQHLSKQSQFIDARLGCIASAEALFGPGSIQAVRTAEAFDAVEILDTPGTPEPPRLPPVQGDDSTLLIGFDPSTFDFALGRVEKALGDSLDGVGLIPFVLPQRPSVTGDGTVAVFVDSFNDLGMVHTDDPNTFQTLGFPGVVHSVAISPDGTQLSFVLLDQLTGSPDNRITVVNLVNQTERTFELLLPVADGDPANLVLYADSMVFSSDGQTLIYDAVSQIRFGTDSPVLRWSIFKINLPTESTTLLVPPLEGYDTGNPNLGRSGNRYLTFDANDLATGETYIANLDLFSGEVGVVGHVGVGIGYPSFSGDESAVVYATRDGSAFSSGYSLVRQALSADRLTVVGDPVLWVYDVRLGTIYRRGTFATSNALPTVTIVSPANNSVFAPPAAIEISTQAQDTDGSIVRVEFYDGAKKLGEDGAAPFQFVWSNVPAGRYRIIARAIDDHGGSTDSVALIIEVKAAQAAQFTAVQIQGNRVRLRLRASPGSYTIQDSTSLLEWSDAFTLDIDASGEGFADDTRSLVTRRFYRARHQE